jgi:hypothetical protein
MAETQHGEAPTMGYPTLRFYTEIYYFQLFYDGSTRLQNIRT